MNKDAENTLRFNVSVFIEYCFQVGRTATSASRSFHRCNKIGSFGTQLNRRGIGEDVTAQRSCSAEVFTLTVHERHFPANLAMTINDTIIGERFFEVFERLGQIPF